MSTFLFDDIVFGPIKSRRFGQSLGINLLSTKEKVCNYDCIYCECGFTDKNIGQDKFCNEQELLFKLQERLQSDIQLDAITYAGNGEPTLHPRFDSITESIKELRDKYSKSTKIVLLTNGTTLHKAKVKVGLEQIDEVVIKLDAGSDELLKKIDQPLGKFSIEQLIKNIKELNKPVIIQTLFLQGKVGNEWIDNTSKPELKKWIEHLETIKPEQVMIYSIARDTPVEDLQVVSSEALSEISKRLQDKGFSVLQS